MLIVAGAATLPLFYYLQTNPGAEVRLSQLAGPLEAALAGDLTPLWQNVSDSLRILTIKGDTLWRYNIPGRPFLGPVIGSLFYAGLLLAGWISLRALVKKDITSLSESTIFALAWLVLGMIPAFITGPEASVTRVIGMQPVLYLFPALMLATGYQQAVAARSKSWQVGAGLMLFLLYFSSLAQTYRDYFVIWGNEPEVRVQYETTLVTALDYLNQWGEGSVAISSPTPDTFHSPSTALMMLRNPNVELRWFNGHGSLIIPKTDRSTLIFPGFAELNRFLAPYFLLSQPTQTVPLRSTDIDRPLSIYQLDGDQHRDEWQRLLSPVVLDFGDAMTLLGYDLQTPQSRPGEQVRLVTRWQVRQSEPDLVLFTHLVTDIGSSPLADANHLDVPSTHWIPGDQFLQLHVFDVPAELPPGVLQAPGRRFPACFRAAVDGR